MDLEICFKEDYEYSKKFKIIYSTFYVRKNNICFPDSEWCDFPIPVLGMWILEMIKILKVKNKDFILSFMDGPYEIECKNNLDIIHMQFINFRKKRIIEEEFDINKIEFANILYIVSKNVIESVKMMNFGEVQDLFELEKLANELHENINV